MVWGHLQLRNKEGDCRGDNSKISWTQLKQGQLSRGSILVVS